MTTKYTPGPWHVGIKQAEVIVYTAQGWAIADATIYHSESDREECQANARLIAAAPDLLEALRALMADVDLGEIAFEPEEQAKLDAVRAAIAKATGEKS